MYINLEHSTLTGVGPAGVNRMEAYAVAATRGCENWKLKAVTKGSYCAGFSCFRVSYVSWVRVLRPV